MIMKQYLQFMTILSIHTVTLYLTVYPSGMEKKYHYQKGDWEKYIQPITNRDSVRRYGLSTIEIDERNGKRRGRDSIRNGIPSVTEVRMEQDGGRDVDACIIQAASFESFVSMFENKGYEVKNANGEGKYLAVKPQGMKRL